MPFRTYYKAIDLDSTKTISQLLPLLSQWENPIWFLQRFVNWHVTDWSTKHLWDNQLWYSFEKIVLYWSLQTFCKTVLILFINRTFLVNLGNKLFQPVFMSNGLPQGSLLGLLLFFIYINDLSEAVKRNLSLYTDVIWLVSQHKDIIEIEKQRN